MARQFQNLETQHLHDSIHGKAAKAPAEPHAKEGEQDHDSVVPEHGKAHEIHIKHDHARGVHHVKSTHEDGHVHAAKFGSAAEAHDHASKMAGEDEGEEQAASMGDESKDKGEALGIGY